MIHKSSPDFLWIIRWLFCIIRRHSFVSSENFLLYSENFPLHHQRTLNQLIINIQSLLNNLNFLAASITAFTAFRTNYFFLIFHLFHHMKIFTTALTEIFNLFHCHNLLILDKFQNSDNKTYSSKKFSRTKIKHSIKQNVLIQPVHYHPY